VTDSAEVTAAEIARLAGVGRAAVGNWRKRYADFPQPIGGSTGSPTFRLGDVERWLEANNRKPADEPRQRVRRILLGSTNARADQVIRLAEQVTNALPGKAELASRARRGKAGQELRDVVADIGPAATFDLLLDAYLELPALAGETPAAVSRIMAGLVDLGGRRVHDPACGVGGLLASALAAGAQSVTGLAADAGNAAMARMRLAFLRDGASEVRHGDLRHDPYPGEQADVVLCHPPFAVRQWGAEELAYDERWEYGVPSKQESELAWVQHCLARARPGGTVVILLPPAVASRGSGRRIRAELLRRGALRAVASLPPGTASPPHLSLHLWLLTRPVDATLANSVRLIDASTVDPAELVSTLTAAVHGGPDGALVPVVDLLDDEVDVTPARHLVDRRVDAADVLARRDQLAADLGALTGQLPALRKADDAAPLPMTTIADLARAGALAVHSQPDTVVASGDVLVVLQGPDLRADVATGPGELGTLGANRVLLRPDPNRLDSWFLAGFVARPSNYRLISSLGSTQRLDLRRASVPRIPLERQRGFAATFAALRTFRDCLAAAAENGHKVANLVAEGLASGTLSSQA
jgi:hypothetical protein